MRMPGKALIGVCLAAALAAAAGPTACSPSYKSGPAVPKAVPVPETPDAPRRLHTGVMPPPGVAPAERPALKPPTHIPVPPPPKK